MENNETKIINEIENKVNDFEKKSYAIIKLPLKVENMEKANDILGNKKDIYSKIKNDQDLEFNYFYNKLTLENCFSNDLLLKRKTYRNKKDKNKIKNKYEILGKITNNMQSFSLENFIYINEEKTNLDDLQNYIIPKDIYEEEIKDKVDIRYSEENQIISNIIKRKHKEINQNRNEKRHNLEDFFSFIQPLNFANFKNSSQNVPKLVKDKIEIDKLKEL